MPGKTYPSPCPDCAGECWDNREGKRNPKAPDAKCKDKSCGGVIWPPKKSDFRKVKDTMNGGDATCRSASENLEQSKIASMIESNAAPNVQPAGAANGIDEARKHLMQSANLLNLCIDCVEKTVWPHLVAYSQKEHSGWLNCEMYLAQIGKLYIEASSRRTNDGVNWWSYIDRMPDKPIK